MTDTPTIADLLPHWIHCALWASSDTPDHGEPIHLEGREVDESVKAAGTAALTSFLHVAKPEDVATYLAKFPDDYLAHDLFLTQCGHGAGFWDRGLGEVGTRLTEAAKSCGSVDLYLGDDGRVYV